MFVCVVCQPTCGIYLETGVTWTCKGDGLVFIDSLMRAAVLFLLRRWGADKYITQRQQTQRTLAVNDGADRQAELMVHSQTERPN